MSKSYGLKLNSPYYNEVTEIIEKASGIIDLKFGKSYIIKCIGDTSINHNIMNGIINIICESESDNINININCKGTANNMISDIYHKIINKNKNVQMNINMKCIASNNSRVIYRSSLSANNNTTGEGNQSAKFIVLDDMTNIEIDAVPALDIASRGVITSHKLSISNIKKEDRFYLALFGYDNKSIDTILTENI